MHNLRRRQGGGRPGVWALCFAAALPVACSTIDSQVENWPQDMRVTLHKHVGFWEIQSRCWQYLPLWRKALGSICTQVAVLNLDANSCDLYTMGDSASAHELAHCKGGDHDGALQKYFDDWRKANRSATRSSNTAQTFDNADPHRLIGWQQRGENPDAHRAD